MSTENLPLYLSPSDGLFLSIEGLIGTGKSTLTKSLSEKMGLPAFYEEVTTNRYLEDFYGDMKKFSFPLQIYLLNKRFEQHQKIIWNKRCGIEDRSIYADSIFAKMLYEGGLMTQKDYETYLELFYNINNFMRKPNIIVYLDAEPSVALERIKMRSRGMETSITVEYLTSLRNEYENFIKTISRTIPVIRINWNEFMDIDIVADLIIKEYAKISTIHTIDFKHQVQ